MKNLIQSMLAVAALSLSALTAQAQTAPKILVVDLAKIFDTHYKTVEQTAKFKADGAKAQDQLDEMKKEGDALVAEYRDLDEQSKNPAASADAKAKTQADMQKKADEIQQKRTEVQNFIQQAQSNIQQRFQTFKQLMIEEISKTAVDIAKQHGATFLLDKSGPTMVGVSNILYYDPSLDITDEVIAAINKDRPAVTPTPTDAAPAAGTDTPKITVPGISPSN